MWIRDGWSVFFGLISLVTVVTLIAPAAFGLQNFTQWGGMYDDHWCNVDLYSGNPKTTPKAELKHQLIVSGGNGHRVYSAPAHNRLTCTVWAKTLCGTEMDKGSWKVMWVVPMLQSQKYLGTRNPCDLNLPPETADWFFTVPKNAKEK